MGAAGYKWTSGSRQVGHDVEKRKRVDLHGRWETGKGRKSRMAETKPEGVSNAQWHNYIHSGGDRPGEAGGYGAPGAAPTMGEAPVWQKPEYDEGKVSALTQKRAAPGVRRLRETTQQAMSATYDNPNVKKMTVRDALAGYGTGLESVMAGAGTTARAEYGQEYAADVAGSMATFQGQLTRRAQEFDVQSRNYLMGRENEYWKQRQDYESDPYSDFEAFYG